MSYAEDERTLLNHYNLQSINPTQWPYDANEDDKIVSKPTPKDKFHRRRTVLGRAPSLRSNASGGSQQAKVQKDEPDPLGTSESVVQTLRYRGLPIEEDLQLRNQFLLSSTTFSPTRYLAEVHHDASTDQLLRGLDFLSRSIEKKSSALKVLVESNFERFVKAKSTVDNVFNEMRNHGAEPENERAKPHTRQTSRNMPHFRTGSGQGGPTSTLNRTFVSEKRKHALIKESEYGTAGIKLPLIDAAVKAEEIWGPTLGNRDKEESLKAVLTSVEQNQDMFESAAAIDDSIRRGEYRSLVDEYAKVQQYAVQARSLADKVEHDPARIPDQDLHQIIVTARLWMDVEDRIGRVKRDLWAKLTYTHPSPVSTGSKGDEHMELITILLQLGVEDNPIMHWLESHQNYLQHKISSVFERSRVELEILRRRLSKNGKTNATLLAKHLRTASEVGGHLEHKDVDMHQVLAYWEKLESSIDALLSTKTGILGEVTEFWETTQGFIDGKKQKSLPIGIDGQSRHHHKLSQQNVYDLQRAPVMLFGMIREQLHNLFLQDPVDDVSALMSPIPKTPITPESARLGITPVQTLNFSFKPEDMLPPTPNVGENWEKLAFWPPYSNCLSASIFLSKIVLMLATAASEMASVSIFRSDEAQISQLRSLVSDVRERFNTATCSAWVIDSSNVCELEDWTRSPDKPDVTNMPARFTAWESTMLANLQKILYIPEAAGTSSATAVIVPPSQRLVEIVQRAFRNSLYKSFDGMMQFARKPVLNNGFQAGVLANINSTNTIIGVPAEAKISDARKLLTISNLQHLRQVLVPTLISLFESNFSLTISSDARTLRDALSQMSSQVFKAYLKPTLIEIDGLVHAGIADPKYTSPHARPDNAKPYIYSVLSVLVSLHTEVSSTTPGLIQQMMQHCLEHVSTTLVQAFTDKPPPFSLPHLIQSTLDVEFLAQTLSSYTTTAVTDLQGKIYAVMDEKTDNDARVALQNELAGMRGTLKRLRDGNRTAYAGLRRPRSRAANREEGRGSQRGRQGASP